VKEQSFATGVVALNYAEGPPTGPPLVLLHGLATRWQIFRPLMRALSKEWHVYALDFRGHGKSGRVTGRYGVRDMIDDTIAFLEAKIAEPAVLFGHSMGGWVAVGVGVQRPEAVRAIVLADTALYPARLPDDATLAALFGADATAIRTRGVGALTAVTGWQSLKEMDPDVLSAYLDGRLMEGFDADVLLPRVSCPVLLLQGDADHGGFMTDTEVERGISLLPRAKHVRFGESGHWLHVQQPGEVAQETKSFLAGIR
jgi:pimeloyl-ACP methyl ester carboxylesterase